MQSRVVHLEFIGAQVALVIGKPLIDTDIHTVEVRHLSPVKEVRLGLIALSQPRSGRMQRGIGTRTLVQHSDAKGGE